MGDFLKYKPIRGVRINRSKIRFVQAFVGAILISTPALSAVRVETAVEPQEIFIGESATLTVRLSGFQTGMEPDLTKITDTELQSLGHSDQHFQNITIVNGQRQVNTFSGRIFQYRVLPKQTGRLILGPIQVTLNGQTIAENKGPVLRVIPVPVQNIVQISLTPSKPKVILQESFTVNLRIRIQRLPPPHSNISPIAEEAPPFLSIPYLDRAEIDGFERENIQERLNNMLVSGRGDAFRINGFTSDASGGFFVQPQQARFRLNREDLVVNGNLYYEYALDIRFTAQREGLYEFGPVVFKGKVLTSVTSGGSAMAQSIYAVSETCRVEVSPPPARNRPLSYVGAIGSNLFATASLDTQTCYAGDPLALTLEIKGDVHLGSIIAPRLERQIEPRQGFRIYDDTVQPLSRPDARIYRYTVRPVTDGTLEFPALAISYYDTITSAYRTVYTEPIPVRANAVTEVQDSMIISGSGQRMTIQETEDGDVRNLPPAPFHMSENPAAVQPFYRSVLHSLLLLTGPLLWLLKHSLRLWQRLSPAWRLWITRRSAAAIALQSIEQAGQARSSQTDAERNISEALRIYTQDRLELSALTSTPGECAHQLQSAGFSKALSNRLLACLERCEASAFSGQAHSSAQELEPIRQEAAAIIQDMETHCATNHQKRQARSAVSLTVLLPIFMTLSLYGTSVHSDIDFEVQRTISVMLNASTAEDFAEAAELLAELIDQGASNPTVFYNYGTALLMAGDPTAALEALARAERLAGENAAIKRNMLLARQALNENDPAVNLPWQRIPLFWHFRLSTGTRLTIATTAGLLLWICILFRNRRFHSFMAGLFWVLTGITLIFVASVLSSIYAEHQASIDHQNRRAHVEAFNVEKF